MSEPFIAEVRIFAGNFAPRGWSFCNGQLLPIAQNTALFSLIGTTYGGDGESTTALPDLQGRVPMGPGDGPNLSSRRLGDKGGVETVTLTNAQMPNHNHATSLVADPGTEANTGNPVGARHAENPKIPKYHDPTNVVETSSLPSAGGSQAHNNLAPYAVVNFIIALQGLYPSES